MKICHIGNAQSIFVKNWTEHFACKGHEVHLISYMKPEVDPLGVHMHILSGSSLRSVRILGTIDNWLKYILATRRIIRRIKPDLVHAHYLSHHGFLGALSGFHPLICQAFGSDVRIAPKKSRVSAYFVKYAIVHADRILTTSGALAEDIINNYPKHATVVVIPPIGIDLNTFTYKPERNGNEFVIFSSRGDREDYRQEIIDEAVALLRKTRPLYNIRYMRAPHGLGREEMVKLYHQADCVVSIPRADQFSSCLQEGMACGCIPIVCDLPVYREYLTHEYNSRVIKGLVCPVSVAEEIEWCIENPDQRYWYTERNRLIAERLFDWNKCVAGLEEIYEEVTI